MTHITSDEGSLNQTGCIKELDNPNVRFNSKLCSQM